MFLAVNQTKTVPKSPLPEGRATWRGTPISLHFKPRRRQPSSSLYPPAPVTRDRRASWAATAPLFSAKPVTKTALLRPSPAAEDRKRPSRFRSAHPTPRFNLRTLAPSSGLSVNRARSHWLSIMLRFLAAAACGFSLAWSVSIHSMLSVFNWADGQGPLAVGLCAALLMLSFSAALPVASQWAHAWSPRWLLITSAVLVGSSQFACAAADGLLALLAGYGLLLGIGLACVHAGLAKAAVSHNFAVGHTSAVGNRQFAASNSPVLAIAGVGAGLAIAGPLLSAVIAATDFRIAFCVSGGLSMLLLLCAAFSIRTQPQVLPVAAQSEPAKAGSVPLALALRTGKIWVLASLLLLAMFAAAIPLTWLAAQVNSRHPSESPAFFPTPGGIAIGVLGACLALAAPLWSALAPARRLGARASLVLCPLFMAMGLANLYAADEIWQMLVSCALLGFALSGALIVSHQAAAERYGLAHLGPIWATICSVGIGLGGAAGALASGMAYAKFDTSAAGLPLAAIACFAAALGAAVLLAKFRTPAHKPDLADEQTAGWRVWPHNWPLSAIRRWRLIASVAGAVGLATMIAGHHRSWKVTVDEYGFTLHQGELTVGAIGSYVSTDAASVDVGPVAISTEQSFLPIRLEWRPFMADSEIMVLPIWMATFPMIVLGMWCHFTLLGLARGRLGKNCGKCGYDLRRTPVSDGKKQCPECGERWAA